MTTRIILERDLDKGVRAELYEMEGGSPEIFIDGAWGAAFGVDGIFKINLFTRCVTGEGRKERREIAARLAMTGLTLAQLAKFLTERVQDMAQHELIIGQTVGPPQEKPAPAKSRKKTPSKKSTPAKRRRSKAKSK